ncbi:caspase, EACC1-associated type [Burkholderia gladioli]|uniref:caspase, EACC1-associated type n=1 Tax=Burkholderia gladioli TaxID=28095 RepID=UPI0022D9BA45|nr:caspase family protein [Burkholderia gladioli]MDA0576000.1 caspase family protein [Burkholderia gladioli]MDA0604169.1 caspase family protein [Burkholderia gladioli]
MLNYPQSLSYGSATRVVLFGTTSCPNDSSNLPDLPQVKNNIEELERIFLDSSIIGLPRSSVVKILDAAESSEVATLIDKAASEATDTLIVYYAGHGLYGDAHTSLYLTSKNTDSRHKPSALRVDLIRQAMSNSPARKRILILDCCYSGRAFTGAMANADSDLNQAIDLTGTYGIAAVPGDHKALAPPGAIYTKFSGTLISVLTEGVREATNVLSVDDVFNAVKSRIRREAATELPQHSNWNEGGNFRLAFNRSARDKDVQSLQADLMSLRAQFNEQAAVTKRTLEHVASASQLRERLDALEILVRSNQITVNEGRTEFGLWDRVDISKDLWDALEADPFKINIKNYFSAKRDVPRCFLAWACLFILSTTACFIRFPNPFSATMDRVAFILSSIYVIGTVLMLALAILILKDEPGYRKNFTLPKSPDVRAELATNLKLHEAIHSNVDNVFGFWFDVPAVMLSLPFNAIGLCAMGFIMWLTGVWRVPFHPF